MDHPLFDEDILDKGTAAILKTRDGKLRAAVPNPIGTCTFLNDVEAPELNAALRRHKQLMKEYPRNGEGIESYVDASDTGYTENNVAEVKAVEIAAVKAGSLNANGAVHGGKVSNGHVNGYANGHIKSVEDKISQGITEGLSKSTNGFTNGSRA